MARVVIMAVVLEGRSKSEVAREYGVSRRWVEKLVARYLIEGVAAFEPHSRRPHTSPGRIEAPVEETIVGLRKELGAAGAISTRGTRRSGLRRPRRATPTNGRLALARAGQLSPTGPSRVLHLAAGVRSGPGSVPPGE
jgi:transposase-like protein